MRWGSSFCAAPHDSAPRSGRTLFQYAEDVAKTLLLASRAAPAGARVFNLGGSPVAIGDWVDAIEEAVPGAQELITYEAKPLPFPSDIQHDTLATLGAVPVTPYREAIAATARIYQRLAAGGVLVGAEHGIPAPTAAAATAAPAEAPSAAARSSA
jgi:UDP-glucuronate 4-epimerase